MAPFAEPLYLISGSKERIHALHVNGMNFLQITISEEIHSSIGDRLFIWNEPGQSS